MNQNEFCDILLVMMGVFMIFFISTRKPKELFKICDQKILKKKKKLKIKPFDKTLSNDSNISKSFLSKEKIKNSVNDQNIIINKLNNLDNYTTNNKLTSNKTNLDQDNSDEPNFDNQTSTNKSTFNETNLDQNNSNDINLDNQTSTNKYNFNKTNLDENNLDEDNLDNEIDGFVKINNYGNLDLSFPENNITNIPPSYNYNNQNLSKLNNYRNIENEYTIINQDKISDEKLDESKSSNISDDEELDNISNSKNIDNTFNNANLSKNCYIQVGGNDNQDLVYGLQQNEMKSFKKNDITNYENEKKCSTLKNAVLNLNRTGYLKSDLVEKSWNETFKPECGNL